MLPLFQIQVFRNRYAIQEFQILNLIRLWKQGHDLNAEATGQPVQLMYQKPLPAGFDIGKRGSRYFYLVRQLFLGESKLLPAFFDGSTEALIKEGRIHKGKVCTKVYCVNTENMFSYST